MSKKSLVSFYICFFVFGADRIAFAEDSNGVLPKSLPRKEKTAIVKKTLVATPSAKKEKKLQKSTPSEDLFRPVFDATAVELKLDQALPETNDYPIFESFLVPPPACASCFK